MKNLRELEDLVIEAIYGGKVVLPFHYDIIRLFFNYN